MMGSSVGAHGGRTSITRTSAFTSMPSGVRMAGA